MDKFLDFGFESRTRKLSEKMMQIESRQKLTYPGKQDLTKKILTALQKSKKSQSGDPDDEGISRIVIIKE